MLIVQWKAVRGPWVQRKRIRCPIRPVLIIRISTEENWVIVFRTPRKKREYFNDEATDSDASLLLPFFLFLFIILCLFRELLLSYIYLYYNIFSIPNVGCEIVVPATTPRSRRHKLTDGKNKALKL